MNIKIVTSNLKVLAIILAVSFAITAFGLNYANAQGVQEKINQSMTTAQKYVGVSTESGKTTVYSIIGNVIQIAFSLLTIFFFVLFIYNGYLWMSAAGNDEQVKKAQRGIKNALIGLLIVLLGYGITYMVFSVLEAQFMLL